MSVGLLLGHMPAFASDWRQSGSLLMTLEHDSNPLLSPTSKKGVSRTIIAPNYNLTGTYGADEFKAGLGLRIERSSDKNIRENRDDPELSFGWQRQTETGGLGLTAKYDEASARFSELAESGLVIRDGKRKTQSLAGNWRSAVSERTSLAADAEYKSVIYDGGALTDFTNLTGGLTFGYAWSERIEPFIRAAASHYEPSGSTLPSSDNTSLLGGVKWKSSEYLEWTAQAGANRVSGRTSDTGWIGSLALRYLGPRNDFSLDVGREVNASGQGGFVESDQIRGAWSYALGERARTGVDVSWRDNKGINPNTLRQLTVWAGYELSQFWNARLYYQRRERLQNGLADATGNVLGLTLVYAHPGF